LWADVEEPANDDEAAGLAQATGSAGITFSGGGSGSSSSSSSISSSGRGRAARPVIGHAAFAAAAGRLEPAPQALVDALVCGTFRPTPHACPRDSDILQRRPKWDGAFDSLGGLLPTSAGCCEASFLIFLTILRLFLCARTFEPVRIAAMLRTMVSHAFCLPFIPIKQPRGSRGSRTCVAPPPPASCTLSPQAPQPRPSFDLFSTASRLRNPSTRHYLCRRPRHHHHRRCHCHRRRRHHRRRRLHRHRRFWLRCRQQRAYAHASRGAASSWSETPGHGSSSSTW